METTAITLINWANYGQTVNVDDAKRIMLDGYVYENELNKQLGDVLKNVVIKDFYCLLQETPTWKTFNSNLPKHYLEDMILNTRYLQNVVFDTLRRDPENVIRLNGDNIVLHEKDPPTYNTWFEKIKVRGLPYIRKLGWDVYPRNLICKLLVEVWLHVYDFNSQYFRSSFL